MYICIYYVIISEDLEPHVQNMVIDEEGRWAMSSFLHGKIKRSDHFTQIVSFDINIRKQKPIREEIFNFKNVMCQEEFTRILNTENNLEKCFLTDEDMETQVQNWWTMWNSICSRSFDKQRITKKPKVTEVSELLRKRDELIQKVKLDSENTTLKNDIEDIESQITDRVSKENRDKIFSNFQSLETTLLEGYGS